MLKRYRIPTILVYVPFLWVGGLAIFPFVFCSKPKPSARLINHERIHLRQQLELFIVPFYVWYIGEYLIRLIQYKNADKAYRNICFEREAYAKDQNLDYLKSRRLWSFWKYL